MNCDVIYCVILLVVMCIIGAVGKSQRLLDWLRTNWEKRSHSKFFALTYKSVRRRGVDNILTASNKLPFLKFLNCVIRSLFISLESKTVPAGRQIWSKLARDSCSTDHPSSFAATRQAAVTLLFLWHTHWNLALAGKVVCASRLVASDAFLSAANVRQKLTAILSKVSCRCLVFNSKSFLRFVMSFSHNHAFLFTNILGVHACSSLLERAKNISIVSFVLLKKLHGSGSARLKVSWIVVSTRAHVPFKASLFYCVTVGTIYEMMFLSLVRGGNLSSLVLCGVVAAATSSKRFADEKTSCGVSFHTKITHPKLCQA